MRRLRRTDGSDAGGYRYSGFGVQYPADQQTPVAAVDQPLRWKGRWWSDFAKIYDVRARQWSPDLGSFTSVDEFRFHSDRTTLWGWPNQDPVRYMDRSGRCAICFALAVVGAVIVAGAYLENDTIENDVSQGELDVALVGATLPLQAGAAAGAALSIESVLGPLLARTFPYLFGGAGASSAKIAEEIEEQQQCPVDPSATADRLLKATEGVQGNGQRMLAAARTLSATQGMSPNDKAAVMLDFFRSIGFIINPDRGVVESGGELTMYSDDLRYAFKFAADGSIAYGKFDQTTLDYVWSGL